MTKKSATTVKNESDAVFKQLDYIKSVLSEKLSQTRNKDKVTDLKKQRKTYGRNKGVKERKAHLITAELLDQALEVVNSKDNAQAACSVGQKSYCTLRRSRKNWCIAAGSINISRKVQWWPPSRQEQSIQKMTTSTAVKLATKKLKKKNAEGPNGVRAGNLKIKDETGLPNELNEMSKNTDGSLTSDILVPIGKSSKDQTQVLSFRPPILI